MSLLDKMNGHGADSEAPKPSRPNRIQPRFLPSERGTRHISMAAIVERIVEQFMAEESLDGRHLPPYASVSEQLQALRPSVEYILAIESIQLDMTLQAEVIQKTYEAVFGLGGLETLLDDLSITTIALEGIEKISIRRGHGDLEWVAPIIENDQQLDAVFQRLLERVGAVIKDDSDPFIELGFQTQLQRRVVVHGAMPPATPTLHLDIRLHPQQALTLSDLVISQMLPEPIHQILVALAHSPYGLVVAGQPESGKTTLLNALLLELEPITPAILLERAREMKLPDWLSTDTVHRRERQQSVRFGQLLNEAVERGSRLIALDEVRADEPHSLAPLLNTPNEVRLMWAFRGSIEPKRLQVALAMLARRSDAVEGEALVQRMIEHLPFIITLRRTQGRLAFAHFAEWQTDSMGYPVYRSLVSSDDGELEWSGMAPLRPLTGLTHAFWEKHNPQE